MATLTEAMPGPEALIAAADAALYEAKAAGRNRVESGPATGGEARFARPEPHPGGPGLPQPGVSPVTE